MNRSLDLLKGPAESANTRAEYASPSIREVFWPWFFGRNAVPHGNRRHGDRLLLIRRATSVEVLVAIPRQTIPLLTVLLKALEPDDHRRAHNVSRS
jgi:hypothetical protein